jgi:NDP-sugar pyrophosphorylase family protein
MQALILAGGLGTRLRSVVRDRPKPLAPIGNVPFLEHQLLFLRGNGVRDFVFCVGYLHEQIRDYFQDGRQWDLSIQYSIEEQPLGTGGALKHARDLITGTFLVLNGDTFFELQIAELLEAHRRYRNRDESCIGTLALTQVADPSQYGSVQIDAGGTVVGFHEKTSDRLPDRYVNAGVYVLEPEILDFVPSSTKVSLEREIFPRVPDHDCKLCSFPSGGFFIDIGTPEGYQRFQEYAQGVTT